MDHKHVLIYLIILNTKKQDFGSDHISCILRSWVHEIFMHSTTVSPQLGDNYASKCTSENFPLTKYISPCLENSRN